MKSIFGLLRQAQLGLISLFPVVVGCIRNAPRYEPTPLVGENNSQQNKASSIVTPTGIPETGKKIPKHSSPYASILNKLPTDYSSLTGIDIFFKAIGLSEDLTIKDLPDPSNDVTSKHPPNKLSFFFESNKKDSAWLEPMLGKPEPEIIRSNPLLPHSKEDTYPLVGFLMDTSEELDISEENNSNDRLIACLKKEDQWYYYNKDYTNKTDYPTKEMMELASKKGIIFFHRKKENVT